MSANNETNNTTAANNGSRELRRMPARMQLKSDFKQSKPQSDGSSTETERPAKENGELYTQPFDGDGDISSLNNDFDSDSRWDSDNASIMSYDSYSSDASMDSANSSYGTTYEECGGEPLEDYDYRDESRPVNRFGFVSKKSFCQGSCCSRKSSMSSLSSMCSSAYSADQEDSGMDVDEMMEL